MSTLQEVSKRRFLLDYLRDHEKFVESSFDIESVVHFSLQFLFKTCFVPSKFQLVTMEQGRHWHASPHEMCVFTITLCEHIY
jgi:hypothetical protein